MPIETRYMRSDQQTVNGLTAYVLGLTQTSSYVSIQVGATPRTEEHQIYFYSDVSVRHQDGSEDLIGEKVGIAYGGTSGLKTGTWNCPETTVSPTDAIVVRVYTRIDDIGSYLLGATFVTEQLGANKLESATWTFYYYLLRTTGATLFYWYFRFGTSTYNSGIANFAWSAGAPPAAAKRIFGDGFVWIIC